MQSASSVSDNFGFERLSEDVSVLCFLFLPLSCPLLLGKLDMARMMPTCSIYMKYILCNIISLYQLNWCVIKIFGGGGGAGGGDTFKTPSPYEQLLPLLTPCFKMFLEISLKDPSPPPPNFKHIKLLPPTHHPFPPIKILIIHLAMHQIFETH